MSERWRIIVDREPQKILRKVDDELRRRILAKLHELETEPLPQGVKKLSGHHDLYRVRVGEWRITYAIVREELVILVIEIMPRSGAYRRL